MKALTRILHALIRRSPPAPKGELSPLPGMDDTGWDAHCDGYPVHRDVVEKWRTGHIIIQAFPQGSQPTLTSQVPQSRVRGAVLIGIEHSAFIEIAEAYRLHWDRQGFREELTGAVFDMLSADAEHPNLRHDLVLLAAVILIEPAMENEILAAAGLAALGLLSDRDHRVSRSERGGGPLRGWPWHQRGLLDPAYLDFLDRHPSAALPYPGASPSGSQSGGPKPTLGPRLYRGNGRRFEVNLLRIGDADIVHMNKPGAIVESTASETHEGISPITQKFLPSKGTNNDIA